jgi:hypothetical protein
MRSPWTKSLALSLGLLVTGARGQETVWRSQPARPAASPPAASTPSATLGRPVVIASSSRKEAPPCAPLDAQPPAASIGRPTPVARSAAGAGANIQRVGFSTPVDPLAPVVRGQAPEAIPHKPMPQGNAGSTGAAGAGNGGAGIAADASSGSPSLFGWRRAEEPVATSGPVASSPVASGPAGTVVVPNGSAPLPDSVVGAPVGPSGPPSLFATGPCGCNTCGGPDCGGCGVNCCANGCCPPGNRWYVGAEYLLWWMKGDRTPPLVTAGDPFANPNGASIIGQPTTRILFGGHELETNGRSGIRLNAGYWFTDDHRLGIDFSGFLFPEDQKTFAATSRGAPQLGRPIIDQTPTVLNSAGQFVANPLFGLNNVQLVSQPGVLSGTVDVVRKSTFWGAEANLRRNFLCGEDYYLDGLLGYRMLGLDESLTINEALVTLGNRTITPPNQLPIIVVPAGTSINVQDRFRTSNRFYGAQVGLDGEYRYGPWSLGGKVKLGMGSTQEVVDVSGFTNTLTPPPTNRTTSSSGGLLTQQGTNIGHFHREMFSVIPEVGLTVGYQLTPRLRATLGYNLLYWSAVARPGEQIDPNVNRSFVPGAPGGMGVAKPAFPFAGSDFWAQGLTVGLEYKW